MTTSTRQLIEGFRRFRARHFDENEVQFRALVEQGQSPKVLVVACCDSRVDPALVLDCAPGDLFVVRNVANLVPPVESHGKYHGTSAALEFGVRTLGVQHIIVLGHARCGGIRALMNRDAEHENSFIDGWMELAEAARSEVLRELADASDSERERACERRAILGSLRNLKTFPWIRERVEAGELTLHGWYFDIEHGELLRYDETANRFESL